MLGIELDFSRHTGRGSLDAYFKNLVQKVNAGREPVNEVMRINSQFQCYFCFLSVWGSLLIFSFSTQADYIFSFVSFLLQYLEQLILQVLTKGIDSSLVTYIMILSTSNLSNKCLRRKTYYCCHFCELFDQKIITLII